MALADNLQNSEYVDNGARATRVTLVGAAGAAAGGLTDTELRATPVPVSGTVTATGPLTDTQLRATAVPVSGTVATGALTDTQLRATAVPVSGTVTATGPLTDTQLRATAVPVSGPLTDTQLRATAVPVSGTVTANLPTGTQRVTTLTRFASAGPVGVTAPGTRNITAGKIAYSVAVVTAASTATPTLDGVALPAGTAVTFESPRGDTLEAAVLITVAGDDVILTELA